MVVLGAKPMVKALVWFWLFDETLGANPFTLSDDEIGQHIPSGGAKDEDHDSGDGHGDDQVLGLGKEEREK